MTAALVAQANMTQQVAETTTQVLVGAAGAVGQAEPALESAVAFLNESVLGVRQGLLLLHLLLVVGAEGLAA